MLLFENELGLQARFHSGSLVSLCQAIPTPFVL